jgi:iron complex outermembrane receptor protein
MSSIPAGPRTRILPTQHRPRLVPLVAALQMAPVCVGVGLAAQPTPAHAQAGTASAQAKTFNIPAGPLDAALNSFAQSAGINVSYDASMVQGLSTQGLNGSYTVQTGLAALLAGSGLEAATQPAGGFALRRQAVAETTLQTITVLGSRDPSVPLSNVPASITVVPREEIARQQPTAQRIEDILGRTVPGFNPTNVGVRQIRGRTAQVFVNGVPSNEQLRASAGSDLNLLAPDQLEVIEVARGANSAYGFGSPGGVIALSTRRAESQELTLTTRVGTSFNTSKPGGTFQSSLYQGVSQIVGDFDYHVGVALRKDDLLRDPDGNLALDFNSPALFSMGKDSLYDFDTSLGYKLGGAGTLRLTATAGRAEVDERYESDETGTYREVNSNIVRRPAGDRNVRRHHTLNLSYENRDVAGSAVKLEALAGRVHALQYRRPAAVTELDEQTNSYTGLRSSVTTPLDGLHRGATVSYGLDYMRNRFFRPVVNDDTGGVIRFVSPDVTLDSWAPYVQGQAPVGDWRFNAGVRHERYSGSVETAQTAAGTTVIQGGDFRSFSLTLFNAGAVYKLAQQRELYASFSQGAEISQVGRAATAAQTADRVDPQPAKSNQYEIGFRQSGQPLNYSAAAFYTTSDLMSALDCSDPTVPCKPLREPRKFWGVEGTVAWRIDSRWGVGGNVAWMDGRRTLSTGEERRIPLNEAPPLLLGAYVDYAPFEGWTNRLQFDYRASSDPFGASTAFGEGRVDSLFLAHFSTSFDLGPGQMQVGVRNLFDKKYYSIVAQAHNRGFNWIPEQGRRVSISYETKW